MYVILIHSTETFNERNAFIGYQKDTPASVIFHATNILRRAIESASESRLPQHCQYQSVLIQSGLDINYEDYTKDDTAVWEDAVSFICLMFLNYICTCN